MAANFLTRKFDALVNTLARELRPTNYRDLLGVAAELWLGCPPYRQAIIRGTSFFMTEFEVSSAEGVDQRLDEIRQARELLNRRFATTEQPLLALQEALGFGGSCVYLQIPIVRILRHSCGTTVPIIQAMTEQGVVYDLEKGVYKGQCATCKKDVEFEVMEQRQVDAAQKSTLRRIPLALCRMNLNPLTGERKLYFNCRLWDMFANGVLSGDPLFHASTHTIFLESVRQNKEIEMSEKYFHYVGFEDASIIDMNMAGWGLPPFFYAFNDVIAILLLQKYNQVILGDYTIPMRYIAPPPTVGVARNIGIEGQPFDPTHSAVGSFTDFSSRIGSIVQILKANPDKIGIFPYPVQFGYMGVEGKQLLTPDLLQHYIDSLMWNMGIPPEFYRGGLSVGVATPSTYAWLLYIRFWRSLVSNIQKLNQWVTDRIAEIQKWPKLITTLVPPVYSAPENIPILLQLNAQGKVSNETLSRALGVDAEYEQKAVMRELRKQEQDMDSEARKLERRKIVAQLIQEASPDILALQQLQMAAQMPSGGAGGIPQAAPPVMAPGMPQPGVPVPPEGSIQAGVSPAEQPALQSVMGKAQQIAQQLLSTYADVTERAAILRELEAQQPYFAMFVEKALRELEEDAAKQGVKMARGSGARH